VTDLYKYFSRQTYQLNVMLPLTDGIFEGVTVEPASIEPATMMLLMDDAATMDQMTTNAPDPVETVMIGMAGDVIMMEVPMLLNSI
jgi:hypothetical protein